MNAIEHTLLTIEDLLPHRAGMLLIGSVLEVDAQHAVTLSTVKATWPLADQQGVPPLICVELAAQTAGVCNGWDRIRTQGPDSNQMGWLVAVKRADFFVDHLPLGGTIRASAENTLIFDKFREVTSQLYHQDQLVASVVLQLYQA
jgi:predicted hotdog family 3-hydroxylacyl-ACP dehydratase